MTASAALTIDPVATVDEYLDRSDWRVNANANQGYSLGGLFSSFRQKRISIHAPLAGSDDSSSVSPSASKLISIHAPLAGSDGKAL